ncbi:Do family serine endopeptidase [Pantoea sp. Aalb]|uniref:Do family serine endopeptidase n=1 Tax=Pantoea sp. Aalb TaxID=2576762 RepID=UPI001329AE39|nr:Do family serine endopeptidase [Pantoea sp. Aalb]MXP67806.1 Do family serine endopeptidase [Pantoea sp. Aalb]
MKNKSRLLNLLVLSIAMNITCITNTIAGLIPHINRKIPIPSLSLMLEKVLPAVVSIHVEGIDNAHHRQNIPESLKRFFDHLPHHNQPQPFEGLGSGVIINAKKGYILTNNHVIHGANKITVQLNNGKEYNAKIIGYDEQTDIALIQIYHSKNLIQIKIADSDLLKVGDFVVAIGSPFGLGQTATSGIISALGRSGLHLEGLENFIQTDAAINFGNSGGALVNLNGELIGINTAILASRGGNIGIGFAIPSNIVVSLATQLTRFGKVKRSQLGVKGTEMTPDIAKALNVNVQRGAFISEVLPNSPASKAHIKAGDIIISVNNKMIINFAELRVKVATTSPGQKLKIGLLRAGKSLTITVTLREQKKIISLQSLFPSLQGATLSNGFTKSGHKGIKVNFVEKNTPAEQVGLQKDDVIVNINRIRVRNLAEMRKAIEDKFSSLLALKVIRGYETIYLILR